MNTYWISFAKDKCVGICIVDGISEKDALQRATNLDINPGGEALIVRMDLGKQECPDEIERLGKDKLIAPDSLMAIGYSRRGDLDDETKEMLDDVATIVCEHKNHDIKSSKLN